MIPTVTLIKDGVIVLALAVIIYMVYRAGEDRVTAKDLQGIQDQMKRQGEILAGWRQESTDANSKLSADVAKINADAAGPHQPVWLCGQAASKPTVLPTPARKAGTSDPTGGRTVEGARRDIQPQLTAFKQRWELILAGCRAEDNSWPR
jgi:hypothetical protein